ncbi:MAG: asparaginase [Bacillota bacterium]
MSKELVHVLRNNVVESIHRGDIVAIDYNDKVIFEIGDKEKRTFWRSAAKPFQVLPLIKNNGIDKFNLKLKEIALMTASHGGEKKHVKVVKSILGKINKDLDDLDCGISKPMHKKSYKYMLKNDIPLTTANNPCSGKHLNMLAYGLIKGYDLKNYINKEHIIQRDMLDIISKISEIDKDNIDVAVDGCGVSVFGLPIINMAKAYCNLVSSEKDEMKTVVKAMTNYPFYVAGTKRLDTILMQETNGKILAKLGAESVYCIGVVDKKVGIALKIEDGSYRPLNALVPNILFKYGYINKKEYENIQKRIDLNIRNHRGEIVGKIKSLI